MPSFPVESSSVPHGADGSPSYAKQAPRLPKDWWSLDDAARSQRLLHMASSDTYHPFVQAMVGEAVDLETVHPATLADGTPHSLAGGTPLLAALKGRAWQNVHTLLAAGSNPRAVDDQGRHVWAHLLAHRPGHPHVDEEAIARVALALLQAGADANQRHGSTFDERDNTVLHLVYQTRRYHLVDPLLAAGADPHALAPTRADAPGRGRSLLHDLMYFHDRTQPASATAELYRLLNLGLDPNVAYGSSTLRTPLGVTPALDTVAMALIQAEGNLGPQGDLYRQEWLIEVAHRTLIEGRPHFLPTLRALGMDHPEHLRDHNGQTPLLHLVNQQDHPDPLPVIRAYLAEFPDLDLMARDDDAYGGHGLVHVAAFHGHAQVLRWLIDQGLPIAQRDATGETPLDELCKGPGYDKRPAAFEACARLMFEHGLTPAVLWDRASSAPRTERANANHLLLQRLHTQWEHEQLNTSLASSAPHPETAHNRSRL